MPEFTAYSIFGMPIRFHKSAAITGFSPPYRAPILIMTIPASLPLETTALVTNGEELS